MRINWGWAIAGVILLIVLVSLAFGML